MYPGTRNHKTSKHMVQTEEGKEHETCEIRQSEKCSKIIYYIHNMSCGKNVFNFRLTWYMMSVHPSIVIHWNTVNIDRKMLSNVLMPLFGPLQTDSLLVQFRSWPQGRPPWPGGLQTRGLLNLVSSSPAKFNTYDYFKTHLYIIIKVKILKIKYKRKKLVKLFTM